MSKSRLMTRCWIIAASALRAMSKVLREASELCHAFEAYCEGEVNHPIHWYKLWRYIRKNDHDWLNE